MLRILCFASLLLFLTAGVSLADIHSGSDVLGLATGADAAGEFILVDPELGPFDLELLVYGYEHAQGIVGWECAIELTGGLELLSITPTGKADPVSIDPADLSLRAFPLQPLLPTDGIVHLATLHLNLLTYEVLQQIRLLPHSSARVAGAMSFALESSAANDQVLAWPGGCAECPVFAIGSTAQPVVAASWDEVKSLYR